MRLERTFVEVKGKERKRRGMRHQCIAARTKQYVMWLAAVIVAALGGCS